MADSWLIDGNCKDCRRKNYCKSPCTKAKSRQRNIIHNAVMSATGMDRIVDAMGIREQFEDVARFNGMKY